MYFYFFFKQWVHDKPKRITNHKKGIAPTIPKRGSGKLSFRSKKTLVKGGKLFLRERVVFLKRYETK
jgi:hypothetical protein